MDDEFLYHWVGFEMLVWVCSTSHENKAWMCNIPREIFWSSDVS